MVGPERSVSFIISKSEAGERIDRVLIAHTKHLGRRATSRLFAEGRVTSDGHPARKGDTVREGQTILARLFDDDAPTAPPRELDICVVTHDAVVIDKPWGMPSARLPTSTEPDAASALLSRFPEMRGVGYGPREPGLVHRLDTFTSGVLLAARSQAAFEKLRRALLDGVLVKRYLCVVNGHGLADQGTIDAPLGPHEKNQKKVATLASGRPSTTPYRVVSRHGDWALLELRVGAAYRHQVRVHLASIGHPLCGDTLYGGPPSAHLSAGRHALHASYLGCRAPELEPFEARAPLPEDLRALLDDTA